MLAMFNAKFGTSVDRRLVKLREEYGELMEAAEKDIFNDKENLDDFIDELADLPKTEWYKALAERIDREIYRGYTLYPCNYMALDELEGTNAHATHYTDADKKQFNDYLQGQLAKIDIPNKDEAFLRERMLTMYANPLRNYLKVKG